MMLKEELKNIKCEKSDLRKFGIMMGAIFGLLGALFFWRGKGYALYFLIVAVVFLAPGLLIPNVLKPIYKAWMGMATLMGWFMTRVILSVLFFLVVTPIGLIAKLSGKQFLDLKWEESQASYWNYRTPGESDASDYEKQF